MNEGGRWILYEKQDGKRERVAVPNEVMMDDGHGEQVEKVIRTRLDAMLWLMYEMTVHGDNMQRYKIIGTVGFPLSSVEAEIRKRERLFGSA